MTDFWDTQEGYICEGQILGFVTLGTAAVAGDVVTFGTVAANAVVMDLAGTANGDGCAVAMKSGVTGDQIPVVFNGVMKMVAHITCTVGDVVINCATAGTTITYGQVQPLTAINTANHAQIIALKSCNGTGTAYNLGMALQTSGANGDEILVMIGRVP
jgi:hypothetical protein